MLAEAGEFVLSSAPVIYHTQLAERYWDATYLDTIPQNN
jgi:hypothetical protein